VPLPPPAERAGWIGSLLGLAVQAASLAAGSWLGPQVERIGLVIGFVLLLFGIGDLAKARGRPPVLCLLAFASVLGLLVVALIPPRRAADAAIPGDADEPPTA